MLQYYSPTCDIKYINFSNGNFMNETTKIALSQINFEIINTPTMDNSEHEF